MIFQVPDDKWTERAIKAKIHLKGWRLVADKKKGIAILAKLCLHWMLKSNNQKLLPITSFYTWADMLQDATTINS